MSGFEVLEVRTGVLRDGVIGVADAGEIGWEGYGFGMVTAGRVEVARGDDRFVLRAGMWFTLADGQMVSRGGAAMVIRSPRRGLDGVGGPIEGQGRLRYIDGCTDTLLVGPPRLGDPCLNHLHIPAHTDQSAHTHASPRIGVVVRGEGSCVTEERVVALRPGMGWYIPANLRHAFRTGPASLDVIAWHPDSDFGPTDADHPMINRTVL